ncbi:hypothetical protein [Brevundimonas vesicularis]|uniref:Uncharacterized protein n=1 Tax=Brevundimonas vesicularis TaxID=41276 RepID=A0ABU4KPJ5_BREVE|nr:hypothetical protein [Brevundimonas vesicularis]MDX2334635.1 hypothetical protein [Brevundimonas vesicularis]
MPHTEGEWITSGGVVRIADENNITIKKVATAHGQFGDEERKANARLMSAAPDLKAALVAAKQQMWLAARDQWTMRDFKSWAVIQQIDAALSKADGEVRR